MTSNEEFNEPEAENLQFKRLNDLHSTQNAIQYCRETFKKQVMTYAVDIVMPMNNGIIQKRIIL